MKEGKIIIGKCARCEQNEIEVSSICNWSTWPGPGSFVYQTISGQHVLSDVLLQTGMSHDNS